MPFRTIISTENSVSRPRVGLSAPVSITAEIMTTSMLMTDRVRMIVPKGSPRRIARASAWRTTPNASHAITAKSQVKSRPYQRRLDRSASQRLPNARKSSVVAAPTQRATSVRTTLGRGT